MSHLKTYLRRGLSYAIHGVPIIQVNPHINYINASGLLKNRSVIITGGSRGLGYAMAKKFVNEGADVLITGRNEELLRRASSTLGCKFLTLDVSAPDTFTTFLNQAVDKLGRLDILVNNAGISLHEPTFFDITQDSFDSQINTNLRGPLFLTQAFIKELLNYGSKGEVLFISSETGNTVDCRPYGFTKAAINSMVQGLANLFKKKGIRINAIAPGVTATSMTGISESGNLYSGEYGQGRFYLPDEIAEAACFMLSSAADCISGQILTCNNAQTVNARWK